MDRVSPSLGLRVVFQRLPVRKIADATDARLAFLRDIVLPRLRSQAPDGELLRRHVGIVVPHYFDYVRARNLLDGMGTDSEGGSSGEGEIDYAQCSEYADDQDAARTKQLLPEGRTPMVLMTERFHALRREYMPGVRHWVFLGIPQQAVFVPEMVNQSAEWEAASSRRLARLRARASEARENGTKGPSSNAMKTAEAEMMAARQPASAIIAFCPQEEAALARVVGSEKARAMVDGGKGTFAFVT